jgi:hypothetical protein
MARKCAHYYGCYLAPRFGGGWNGMAFVIDSHGMLWRHDALEIGGSGGSVLVRGSSETR